MKKKRFLRKLEKILQRNTVQIKGVVGPAGPMGPAWSNRVRCESGQGREEEGGKG